MAREKLGEILVEAGVIDAAQLTAALAEQRDADRPLGMTLVRMGYLDEPTLIKTLAQQLQLPMVRLDGKRIPQEVLDHVSLDMSDKHRCFPLFIRGEGADRKLFVGMEDPSDVELIRELSREAGMPIQPVLVAPSEIQEAISRHYDLMASDAGSSTPLGDVGDPFDQASANLTQASPSPLDPLPSESELDAALDFKDDSLGTASSETPSFDPEPETAQVAPVESVPQVAILRALTLLLIQKGVFSRDELIERVQAFASQADSDD